MNKELQKNIEKFKAFPWKDLVDDNPENRLYEIISDLANDPETYFSECFNQGESKFYKTRHFTMIRCYPDLKKKIETEVFCNEHSETYLFYIKIRDCLLRHPHYTSVSFGYQEPWLWGINSQLKKEYRKPKKEYLGEVLIEYNKIKEGVKC